MNIKDFLLDNYIWMLVILLITIITIIGFLADKKKSSKKESIDNISQKNNNQAPQMGNYNVAPIQYQPVQSPQPLMPNEPINFSAMNTTVQPINSMNQQPMNNNINYSQQQPMPINNMVQNTPMNDYNQQPINNMMNQQPLPEINQQQMSNMMNQPFPMASNNMQQGNINNQPIAVEPINNYSSPEPMYQPLSEQRPVIEPAQQYVQQPEMAAPMNNNMMNQPLPMPEYNQPTNDIQQGQMPNYNYPSEPQMQQPQMMNQQQANQPVSFVFGPQNNQ